MLSIKLVSRCIAERIKTVLDKIISRDQTGFLKSRFKGENIRLIYDLMNYTEVNQIPGLLILIDFEKAFDSISWNFIFQTLDLFNFGFSIKDWTKTFYSGIKWYKVMHNTKRNNLKLFFFHKEAVGKTIRFHNIFFFYVQRF